MSGVVISVISEVVLLHFGDELAKFERVQLKDFAQVVDLKYL